MKNSSAQPTSAEALLAEREQTLLEQQERLDKQQQRLDETFQDLVKITLELRQLQRSKDTLSEQLEEKSRALRDADLHVGTLVGQLEEQDSAVIEAEEGRQALEDVVHRQNQELGRLVALLEHQQHSSPLQAIVAKPGRFFFGLYRRISKRRQQKARTDRDVEIIEASPWFDARWYLEAYPDVAADKQGSQTPARHYLLIGAFEGRNPGPDFDSTFYLANNDDVRKSGVNPLLHFIQFGKYEQRQPKANN